MINAILQGIMSLANTLVGLILAPIDALVSGFLPDLAAQLVGVQNAIAAFKGAFQIVISYTFIPGWVWEVNFVLLTLGISALSANTIVGVFKWIKYIKVW